MTEFSPFPKMPRLSRECIVTEKLDGTNASIFIGEGGEFLVGSRNRWITPKDDNYGFAAWAYEHEQELRELGPGHHFGEWWGRGVQRGYGLAERRFSLFNVSRWSETRPDCCDVVPTLWRGEFCTITVDFELSRLKQWGSVAAPGFMQPEGVIVFHVKANISFKKTLDENDGHKGGEA